MEVTATAGSDTAHANERRALRLLTALITLGTFAALVAVQRDVIASYDGRIMADVARNLVEHGSLTTQHDIFGFNTPYASYGIGLSLAALPFTALQLMLNPEGTGWITLVNPVILAVTAGVVFLVGIDLGWRLVVSTTNAVFFALLTTAVWQSTEMLSEPGVALAAILALWGCVRWQRARRGGPLLLGSGIALAILFRTDSLLLVGITALCLPLFVPWRELLRQRRSLITAAIPVVIAVAWVAFYNWLRWDSMTARGYDGYGFSTPLLSGLRMLVLEPGKGFFHYNPILVVALPGAWFLWRRNRALTVTILVMCVARFVFFATWAMPEGGVAWGPRLLFPLCAVLAIPMGQFLEQVAGWDRFVRWLALGAVAVLVVASVIVNVASVWVPYEQVWNEINVRQPGETAADVSGRVDEYFSTWRHSSIAGNLSRLERADPFPLSHWRGGPDPMGVISVLLAVAALTCALALAWAGDHRRRDGFRGPQRSREPPTSPPFTSPSDEPAPLPVVAAGARRDRV